MSFSLTSVTVAVVLLVLIGGATVPAMTSSNASELDASAYELTALLRIAQAEAIRTGLPHGVFFDPASQRISVALGDLSSVPFTAGDPTYHPVSKQPLSWQPNGSISLSPANQPFQFNTGGANQLLFDAWGTPVFPASGGGNRQLSSADLELRVGQLTRTVSMAPVHGRVNLQ